MKNGLNKEDWKLLKIFSCQLPRGKGAVEFTGAYNGLPVSGSISLRNRHDASYLVLSTGAGEILLGCYRKVVELVKNGCLTTDRGSILH